MDWHSLTTDVRFKTASLTPTEGFREPHISMFQKDAQRIIYSTPFRRLQGKTQVHPFPGFDYIRNRLTHTIEVANVGRTIAYEIGRQLLGKNRDCDPDKFADVVYAACLAHDLGNPPFGHVGEYAIQTWFKRELAHSKPNLAVVEGLRENNQDFLNFDGNAQGFRILTRTAGWRNEGGLQLACATLGAFSKYPYSSVYSNENSKNAKERKFGFHAAEADYAREIFTQLGMKEIAALQFVKHPFAYIVEAADDICYLTTDVEDAYRTKHIEFNDAETALLGIAELGNFRGRYDQIDKSEPDDKISYARSCAISALSIAAIENFVAHEKQILDGAFSSSLLETTKFKDKLKAIRKLCNEDIYFERRKLETEAAGINVISTLMDMFGGMICRLLHEGMIEKLDIRDTHLYRLLPSFMQKQLEVSVKSNYESLLILVDYISGMTDRYAFELFAKLTGTSPTIGRMS